MLPGVVEGVHTYRCTVKAGSEIHLETFSDQTQMLYFTKGTGFIVTKKRAFNINEPSLFVPDLGDCKNVLYAVTDMEWLQLTCVMLDENKKHWNQWHIALPRFCPISKCIEYVEGFRPEEIHSYSIVDTSFVTRMTMGAIIGRGPNKAAPHSYDNLYQWYYGMSGTKFTYKAGDEEIILTEGDWAFIPTNIEHSIEIEDGEQVNYVWFEIEVPKEAQIKTKILWRINL